MSLQTLVIPSTPEARLVVEKTILGYVQESGYNDEEGVFSIKLALEETLVNAIRHGNKLDNDKQIRVAYGIDDDGLHIEVEDEGDGFDYDHLPDPTSPDRLELPHGRGIMLIRHYMDKVEFNEKGNLVKLTKRFPPPESRED